MKKSLKITVLFIVAGPIWCFGKDIYPYHNYHLSIQSTITAATDSIPENAEPAAQNNGAGDKPGKPQPGIIKEVPKARKQIKPAALPRAVPIKPLKIVRPKIIHRITGLVP